MGASTEIVKHRVADLLASSRKTVFCRNSALNANSYAYYCVKIYPEQLLGRIAKKAFQFLGCSDSEYFDGMGYFFINFLSQFGYGDVLALLGRELRDFLNGLDNLHEYLKFSYPRYGLSRPQVQPANTLFF